MTWNKLSVRTIGIVLAILTLMVTIMKRFLDPNHPRYWRSTDLESPAFDPNLARQGRSLSIVVCSSRRFYERVEEVCKALESRGFVVTRPAPAGSQEAQLRHLDRIAESDICLIANFDSYIGVSTTLELGYAVAQRCRIVALNHQEDDGHEEFFDHVLAAETPTEIAERIAALPLS